MEETKVIAYKAFDENLCCRGFQFEFGKEYEQEGEIECCRNGFHACINPLDVLGYYGDNGTDRFCIVEQSGIIKSNEGDSMQASSKIKILAEIERDSLFKAGIDWIKEKTNPNTILKTAAEKGGIESGESVHIVSSGNDAHIGSSGDYAHIFSSGDYAQISSSGESANIFSSGDYAKMGSSGNNAKIESSGKDSVICCAGNNSMVKAKKGSWITLSEWKYSKEKGRDIPVCVKTEYVDGERIKGYTWYKLVDGEFKEQ